MRNLPTGGEIKLVLVIFLFYLIPYILDYVFDLHNGLNFLLELGDIYSVWSFCEPDFHFRNHTCFMPEKVEDNRIVWGVFSLLLTVTPGIAFAFIRVFNFLSSQDKTGSSNYPALKLLFECLNLVMFYPFFVVFVHLRSCFRVLTGGDAELSMLLNFGALEVVLESGPQVVLQLHTIMTGYCPPMIQIFTLLSSLLIIGKVAVEFHIGGDVFGMGFVEKNLKLLKLLPLFVTSIIFRIGTLTILTTHIKWWIILPCLVSSVVVAVLASNNEYGQLSAIIAGPVNLFVMGTGMDLEHGFDKNWTTDRVQTDKQRKNQNKFYKESTLFILIWNTLLLAGFLAAWTVVADCNTDLTMKTFFVQDWREKVFMRKEIKSYGLYVVVGGIMFTGFLNALFLFIDTREELDNSQQESRRIQPTPDQRNSFSDEEDYIELSNLDGDVYENAEDVSNRWDQGKMTRANCETKLRGDIVGAFLVRESKGRKVLSVNSSMQKVSHFNLHEDQEREEWSLDQKLYRSLPDLVEYYRDNKLPGQNVTLK